MDVYMYMYKSVVFSELDIWIDNTYSDTKTCHDLCYLLGLAHNSFNH